MHPRVLIGAIVAVLVAFTIFGFGMQLVGRSNYGPGWWGRGMMGGYSMGPGMMRGYGYDMGPWMMGPNVAGGYSYGTPPWMMAPYRTNQSANLSVDDVKNYFERSLAWQGNPRVKLGTVSEKDADTVTADIVTTDKDGLVQRFAVNRHTGLIQSSGD
ncbi:MAG TPA: hypothetical protein VNH44_13930 [Micropepsaceae bacterium]|nr:hypothetical protein [Micropepsaceae bacterium]